MHAFSERSKKILGAIMRDYILTAEPVSSKAVAERYGLGLSPATIRSIMAEFEGEGYLRQPHTSAGRVPTEKSFRFYLDSLLELEELPQDDKEIIRSACARPLDVDGILTDMAKALSAMTGCAGLVFVSRAERFVIKRINIMPLDGNGVVVLMVSSSGAVRARVVRLDADAGRLDLERVSNYLNSMAAGLTVRGLRARLVEEMRKEKNLYDELLAKALSLGVAAFGDDSDADALSVEGKMRVLEQPEFRDDFEKMKSLFSAFEEKSLLVKIIDKSMGEDSLHVYLGSECMVKEFADLSFVTAPCRRDGAALGAIGVIGPVRMRYSRIVPLVEYTAGLLSGVV
jgi:heat-inducible transcriptional repressor